MVRADARAPKGNAAIGFHDIYRRLIRNGDGIYGVAITGFGAVHPDG